jgi:hypothetical protein
MAEVSAPGSQDAPHGRKRSADNSLESEQRLSKRFDLLNLGKYTSFVTNMCFS